MMQSPKIPVVRFQGATLTAGAGVWIVGAFILISLRFGLFPFWYEHLTSETYWMMAALTTAGIALSLVAHDLAHFFTAKLLGKRPSSARIFLFGDLTLSQKVLPRTNEWMIDLAGPLFSLAFGFLLYGCAYYGDTHGLRQSGVGILFHLGAANITLALLNFLPFFPLDAGKLMRFELARRMHSFALASDVAAFGGLALGAGFLFIGTLLIFKAHLLVGMWVLLFGIALGYAAQISRKAP